MAAISVGEEVILADLEVMRAASNYRDWIVRQISPHLRRRILEVGAGIGTFTELLLDREFVLATDRSPECLKRLRERFRDFSNVELALLDLNHPNDSFTHYACDTALAINVLEHVEDDQRALHFLRSSLIEGGRVVLLVPAFPFLFGSIDRAIGHHRRYTLETLLSRMRGAGLTVEHSFYINVIGVAGWYWNNRIRKIPMENPKQIKRFDRYVAPWAERLERIIHPPFGLSLIAVGRRR